MGDQYTLCYRLGTKTTMKIESPYSSFRKYAARAKRNIKGLIIPKIRGVKACDVRLLETQTIFPEEIFKLPERLDIFGQSHFHFSGYSRAIHKFCVSSLKNGKCIMGREEIFTGNDEVIVEYSAQKRNPWVGGDKRKLNKPYIIAGRVANLALNSLENNYFHWMTECLGRYYLLEQSKFRADFYILNNNLSFQKQYIEFLGIDERKIIKLDPGTTIQADEIIAPTLINNYDIIEFRGNKCHQKQWLPSWIGNIYLEKIAQLKLKKAPREKIYISREFAGYRKVKNEGELVNLIKNKGFGVYHLENMTLKEQAELFSNASVILGVHGAGFSNIYFCPKDAIVLECFPEYYHDPSYRILSHALGLRYNFMIGKIDSHEDIHPQRENVCIDLYRLEMALNTVDSLIKHCSN